ncbi:MAG: hypothetical protein ACOYXY_06580 [Thermodesulfobacteriota bacterium]
MQPFILVFMHIGKSGGTTLTELLIRQFPLECRIAGQFDGDLRSTGTASVEGVRAAFMELSPETRAAVRLITGHVPFGLHQFLPMQTRYLTLVRDPVEREISNFYYGRLQTQSEKGLMASRMSFEQYVDQGQFANYFSRLLSGIDSLNPLWDSKTAPSWAWIGSDVVSLVMENIDKHFLIAGPLERFDEYLVLLCRRMGWDVSNVAYTRRNVTLDRPRTDELSPELIKKIRERNEADEELYKLICERFDRDVRSEGDSFQRDLAHFRNLNNEKIKQSPAPVPFWSALRGTLNAWLRRERP